MGRDVRAALPRPPAPSDHGFTLGRGVDRFIDGTRNCEQTPNCDELAGVGAGSAGAILIPAAAHVAAACVIRTARNDRPGGWSHWAVRTGQSRLD